MFNIVLKSYFILIICVLLFFSSFAQQSKIVSLKNVLKTAKEDTNKVTHLNNLCNKYQNIGFYDTALYYGNEALDLGKKINFPKGIAGSYDNIGNIYANQGNYDKALENYFASLKIYEEIMDKQCTAHSYHNVGNIYYEQGNYAKALENHFVSLKIKEEIGDKNGVAYSHSGIGNIYYTQSNYDKALENYFASLKIFEEIKGKKGIASTYNNIGNIYDAQGNYDKALECYFKALKINEEMGNKKWIAYNYGNIGIIYENQGNYEKALENYFASLRIKEEIEDKYGIAASYINIGNLFATEKKFREAQKYLINGLYLAKKIRHKEWTINAYWGLSKLDSMQSNWKGAYQFHQLHSQMKDSLFNEESSKQIAEMSTKYETEKKEQQIKLLEKEGELQKSEVRRQKFIIWSVAGGLLIVVVFSFFIFKERRKSEKLLLNILPVETARELKKKGKALPKHYELVTVLFTDFKGFTKIAEKMSVEELVSELDFVFRKFDEIISKYPIEKIKTIGDAYMCAGGLPAVNTTNPMDAVMAALDIQQFVEDYKQQCIKEGKLFFEIRIGVHSGPVVAGVVGDKKFAYDIWGDTVNTASRMESSGEPGKVNISGSTYQLLQTFPKF